jgi:hypothetical protein
MNLLIYRKILPKSRRKIVNSQRETLIPYKGLTPVLGNAGWDKEGVTIGPADNPVLPREECPYSGHRQALQNKIA